MSHEFVSAPSETSSHDHDDVMSAHSGIMSPISSVTHGDFGTDSDSDGSDGSWAEIENSSPRR